MSRILIAYSTVDGHTRTISERIAAVLRCGHHDARIFPIGEVSSSGLSDCDTVVIGASIRYGNYRREVLEFVTENSELLGRKPAAFFSVNLVARKPGRDTEETNPYISKLLRRTNWRPELVTAFAGRLEYARYRPLDRYMIRFIMWLTGDPDPHAAIQEFTDWNKVEAFAKSIAVLRETRVPTPP